MIEDRKKLECGVNTLRDGRPAKHR